MVGSGVTGAEFAHGYLGLGVRGRPGLLRDRVLPGEDADAAEVIEDVFRRRGMQVLNREPGGRRSAYGGRGRGDRSRTAASVEGSHCLLAVGSVPNTAGLGLDGGRRRARPRPATSRSTGSPGPRCAGVYAAGDCTGVLPLASVAAMQGRIAMWHALGDAVSPINLKAVAANIFTDPEIATVGYSAEGDSTPATMQAKTIMLPLATNARAKMEHLADGFVKLFARPRHRHRRRRGRGGPEGVRADLPGRAGGAAEAHRRPGRQRLHHLPVDERLDRRGRPPAPRAGLTRVASPGPRHGS